MKIVLLVVIFHFAHAYPEHLPGNAQTPQRVEETIVPSNVTVIDWRSGKEIASIKCDAIDRYDRVTAYIMPQNIASAGTGYNLEQTLKLFFNLEHYDERYASISESGYGCYTRDGEANCTVSPWGTCEFLQRHLQLITE